MSRPNQRSKLRPARQRRPRARRTRYPDPIASRAVCRSSIKSRTSSTPTESLKRVGDAKRFALFSRHGRVCHKRRMIDQAFDTAQTFRERKKMRIFKKTPRTREIGFQNHRDHSAETAHLHAREIMLRMRLESGIAD